MPALVNDIDILKQFVPNLIPNAEGERDFFDVLSPHVEHAEEQFKNQFAGEPLFEYLAEKGDECLLTSTARRIVATDAWINAIPSMDLILLPGGNFVVSQNNSHSVASSDRVARLVDKLISQRDSAIISFLGKVYYITGNEWEKLWAEGYHDFKQVRNPYVNFEEIVEVARITYTAVNSKLDALTRILAETEKALRFLETDFLGGGVVDGIINDIRRIETDSRMSRLLVDFRNFCRDFIQPGFKDCQYHVDRIVNDIVFLEKTGFERKWMKAFERSPIMQRFNRPIVFENDKKASGYFF